MSDLSSHPSETQPPMADFGTRVLGWMIDLAALWILYGFISSELFAVIFDVAFSNDPGSLDSQAESTSIYLSRMIGVGTAFGLVGVALMAAFLRTQMATPGQRLVGLMTADSESGAQLTWSQAIGRSLMLYGPWLALMVVPTHLYLSLGSLEFEPNLRWTEALPWVVRAAAGIWYVVLAVTTRNDGDGRGFHDLASRSVVVDELSLESEDEG